MCNLLNFNHFQWLKTKCGSVLIQLILILFDKIVILTTTYKIVDYTVKINLQHLIFRISLQFMFVFLQKKKLARNVSEFGWHSMILQCDTVNQKHAIESYWFCFSHLGLLGHRIEHYGKQYTCCTCVWFLISLMSVNVGSTLYVCGLSLCWSLLWVVSLWFSLYVYTLSVLVSIVFSLSVIFSICLHSLCVGLYCV